jgi:hypothetical protein
MRRQLRTLLETLAFAAAIVVAVSTLADRGEPGTGEGASPTTTAALRPTTPEGIGPVARPALAGAARIAAMFPAPPALPVVPVPEAPPPDVVVPEPEAPRAEWLALVGNATEGTGRRVFFLKDKRTGKLQRAASSALPGEWEVVATHEMYIEIRSPEGTFRVDLP